MNLARAIEQAKRFDVLHSHAYLWGLPLEPFSCVPMIHTSHIVPDENSTQLWSLRPGACMTAISHHQWNAHPELRPTAMMPHGLDPSQFAFQPEPADYVYY